MGLPQKGAAPWAGSETGRRASLDRRGWARAAAPLLHRQSSRLARAPLARPACLTVRQLAGLTGRSSVRVTSCSAGRHLHVLGPHPLPQPGLAGGHLLAAGPDLVLREGSWRAVGGRPGRCRDRRCRVTRTRRLHSSGPCRYRTRSGGTRSAGSRHPRGFERSTRSGIAHPPAHVECPVIAVPTPKPPTYQGPMSSVRVTTVSGRILAAEATLGAGGVFSGTYRLERLVDQYGQSAAVGVFAGSLTTSDGAHLGMGSRRQHSRRAAAQPRTPSASTSARSRSSCSDSTSPSTTSPSPSHVAVHPGYDRTVGDYVTLPRAWRRRMKEAPHVRHAARRSG